MKIEITRSGGIGGMTRTWSIEVSSSEARQRWLPLAEAEAAGTEAGGMSTDREVREAASVTPVAAGRPGTSTPEHQRDRFTYRISIGYTAVTVPESRLEAPWRELIERARAAGAADPPSEDSDQGKPPELL